MQMLRSWFTTAFTHHFDAIRCDLSLFFLRIHTQNDLKKKDDKANDKEKKNKINFSIEW